WKSGGSNGHKPLPSAGTITVKRHPRTHRAVSAHLVLWAVRGGCRLEVHRNSANGKLLYAGTLEPGKQAVSLWGKRLWIRAGARPDELETALREGLCADLCVVSGGLGPTHDDRTIEVLARVAGRKLAVDDALEREIGGVSRRIAERLRRPYADFEAGVRKQATLPVDASSLGLAGTAPGIVLETDGRVAVALPGPPSELQRLWARALEMEPLRRLLARARPPGRRVLRFFGASESAVAAALAEAGGEGEGMEATVCARDFEVHVDLVVDEGGEARADMLVRALRARLGR